jgi:hypothetical protein
VCTAAPASEAAEAAAGEGGAAARGCDGAGREACAGSGKASPGGVFGDENASAHANRAPTLPAQARPPAPTRRAPSRLATESQSPPPPPPRAAAPDMDRVCVPAVRLGARAAAPVRAVSAPVGAAGRPASSSFGGEEDTLDELLERELKAERLKRRSGLGRFFPSRKSSGGNRSSSDDKDDGDVGADELEPLSEPRS